MSFLVLSHAGARFGIAQTRFMFALVMALGLLRFSTLLRFLVIAIQPLAQIPEPSTLNPTPYIIICQGSGTTAVEAMLGAAVPRKDGKVRQQQYLQGVGIRVRQRERAGSRSRMEV